MSESKKEKNLGRPTEVDTPLSKRYLTLDEATIKFFKKIGGGNVSFGAREAARRLSKKS